MERTIGPTSHYFYSHRLKLHYVDWGNPEKPPLLLIHGGRDHARNWDWVAEDSGATTTSSPPTSAGHGDSQWATGSMYATVEYMLRHRPAGPPAGALRRYRSSAHSLGGNIALQYAGTYPSRREAARRDRGAGAGPSADHQGGQAGGRADARVDRRDAGARAPATRGATRRSTKPTGGCSRRTRTCPPSRPGTSRCTAPTGRGRHVPLEVRQLRARGVPLSLQRAGGARALGAITLPRAAAARHGVVGPDPEKDGRATAFRDYQARLNVAKAGPHSVHHDQLDIFLSTVGEFLA